MGGDQSQLTNEETKKVIKSDAVRFLINGKEWNVNPDSDSEKIDAETLLVDYIRDHVGLKGTKFMCREGGCGACVVSVKSRIPNSGLHRTRPVNSCLVRLLSCDGWDIRTIESLGSTKTKVGLHPIQQRMVDFSGTQCGYCTPAWIMNMQSLMAVSDSVDPNSKTPLSCKDIEDSMDGIVCRCTGYRPILDAMKSFAADADAPDQLLKKSGKFHQKIQRPEETDKFIESTTFETIEMNTTDFEFCVGLGNPLPPAPATTKHTPIHLSFTSAGQTWVKATDVNSLFAAIDKFESKSLSYKVVAGNTGSGVYKNDARYQAYVDINNVPELQKLRVSPAKIIVGGSVTIARAVQILKQAAEIDGFDYCTQISAHWSRVANTPVRSLGTLAGNLMLKHQHREFASDIFVVLEAVGALLTIASAPNFEKELTLAQFLNLNMAGKIIISLHFPNLKGHQFRSFKISPRFQNAHAYVNAGFRMKVDKGNQFTIMEKPVIVFGGISPQFVHATKTEEFLVGKFLSAETIQGAMGVLNSELNPFVNPPDADPAYRKGLAQSLLYKFILGILSNEVSSQFKSGETEIHRGLNFGKQAFDTEEAEWPLSQPMPKIEAKVQCTGEAEYITDMCPQSGELAGALVITKVANATLEKIDPSEALKLPGVVAFVDANDIPGDNNYMTTLDFDQPDVIFVRDKISYAGQPVGIILAETRETALRAAKLVRIKYENIKKPILDIPSALLQANDGNTHQTETHFDALNRNCNKSRRRVPPDSNLLNVLREPKKNGAQSENPTVPHRIQGEFRTGHQFHFTMEPQVAICIPKEDCMDVYAGTQWVSPLHSTLSASLAMPQNAINIQVRRLGGAFGARLSRSNHVITACAVAANKVRRPVRLVLDLETTMAALGKRFPYLCPYDVTFDDTGKILSLDCKLICDTGSTSNESTAYIAQICFQSCYAATSETWKVATGHVTTNTPPNTYCRAPGSPVGIACIEYIMDHIAFHLQKKPMDVRLSNLIQKGDPIISNPGEVFEDDNKIPGLLEELSASADLANRENFVESFNKGNRWKKRALAVTPMRYPTDYVNSGYNIFLSVYATDGTVALSHCGIEMGQGINTKVVQVVARELKIPCEKISVKPTNNFTGANTAPSGGAVTSELVCFAAKKACEILMKRLAPVKEKLENPTWEVLIADCHKVQIDLTSYYNTTYADGIKDYNIWGLTATEVEIDCLTGEYKVIRVDLIHDCGLSLNPEIDVGQVEGAFVMGLGLWLTEKIQHDSDTGQILTDRTWNYKPPAAKDIPEDFRVTLLKNSRNTHGVLRSKSAGESPTCMSFSVFLAIKQAIQAARRDAGNLDWFQLAGPVTPEDIHRYCLTSPNQFAI